MCLKVLIDQTPNHGHWKILATFQQCTINYNVTMTNMGITRLRGWNNIWYSAVTNMVRSGYFFTMFQSSHWDVLTTFGQGTTILSP